jgi:hypothetical protein
MNPSLAKHVDMEVFEQPDPQFTFAAAKEAVEAVVKKGRSKKKTAAPAVEDADPMADFELPED